MDHRDHPGVADVPILPHFFDWLVDVRERVRVDPLLSGVQFVVHSFRLGGVLRQLASQLDDG